MFLNWILILLLITVCTAQSSVDANDRRIYRHGYNGRNVITGNFHHFREKRGVKLLVLEGLKAVDFLVETATRLPSRNKNKIREFIKTGGYAKGLDDFRSVKPFDVHSFELPGGSYFTTGRVGDRLLILKQNKDNQAILEILRWKRLGQQGMLDNSFKVTDEITYWD